MTVDQHSLSLVIASEISSMDASDNSKDLKFFMLLLRHTDYYHYYSVYI